MIKFMMTGLKELFNKLDDLVRRVNSYLYGVEDSRPDRIILQAIRDSIDAVGIRTRTGHLKRSFKVVSVERTANGLVYRIASSAPYAGRLNYGAAPSMYYTPGGVPKKLGGNRPFNYLERANRIIAEKMATHMSLVLDRAVRDSGLK